ncbi:MAG TPA: V-type ATP synthase subunit E [Thermoplasmata archaeon]|nr:V-type ATP synthase subunit E [Thermoplasmata archaeon]
MSLDSLIEEIRARGEAELRATLEAQRTELGRLASERDRAIADAGTASARSADAEIARERAQRIAAAKLAARQRLYEARERRLEEGLRATRVLLAEFTNDPEYPEVLRRMVAVATNELGRPIRVSGRAEDAARLGKIAGKSFDPTPRPIVGGLVAETPDGNRRLNLSFDELLRLREDRVRELLA